MLRWKFWVLACVGLLATGAKAQDPSLPPSEVVAQPILRELETTLPTPLFENAPFLRLKTGESLVKAQQFYPEEIRKGQKREAFWSGAGYYLKRNGKYIPLEIWPQEKTGKFRFWLDDLPLFDYERTPENLHALAQLQLKYLGVPVTYAQLMKMEKALLSEFPETVDGNVFRFDEEFWKARSAPDAPDFWVKGLAFDARSSLFFGYTITVGRTIELGREILIRGPVLREEFKPRESRPFVINDSVGEMGTPRQIALRSAQNRRAKRFLEIVSQTLKLNVQFKPGYPDTGRRNPEGV